MSNHFTGLNLGPPEGDTRLDLTDLYAFQVPSGASRTVLILNCNSFAKGAAFHPDAVYRINIDNNGDLETDLALILVFSEPRDGRQRATVYLAIGPEARSAEPAGDWRQGLAGPRQGRARAQAARTDCAARIISTLAGHATNDV